MDMMKDETCADDDMEKIISWWVHSALKEAGTSFAMAISNESDYRDLIENVFLAPDADCIEILEEKRNTVMKFHRLKADLPSTMCQLGGSGTRMLNLNSTDSVVAILTPTAKNSKDNSTGTHLLSAVYSLFLRMLVYTLISQYYCNASIDRDSHRVSQLTIDTISDFCQRFSFLWVKIHSHKSVHTEVADQCNQLAVSIDSLQRCPKQLILVEARTPCFTKHKCLFNRWLYRIYPSDALLFLLVC